MKFVPMGPFENKSAFMQVIAWRLSGDKPLSEPMMTQENDTCMCLPTSINTFLVNRLDLANGISHTFTY